MELLNKLYSMKNFGLYLIIAIIVLVVLFIIIMVFGKKDKKKREIEATAKLQQINSVNAFKEENNISSVETSPEVVMQNDTIVIPTLEAMTKVEEAPKVEDALEDIQDEEEVVINKEEYVENKDEINEEENHITIGDDVDLSEYVDDRTITTPILENVEEKPFTFEETTNITINEEAPKIDLQEEISKPEIPEVEIPIFRNLEAEKEITPVTNEAEFPTVDMQVSEEDDIELPALKKEVKEEDILERTKDIEPIKLNNEYDFDNISGETYTINK